MIDFKELFQQKNEQKIINMFKQKFNDLSKDELKKFTSYKDNEGNSLLHHAYNNNCNELAQFLYDNNIGMNIINNSGNVITSISSINEFSDNENYVDFKQSESSDENTIYSENKTQKGGDPKTKEKTIQENSVKNIIKYTKNKRDMYIEKGKKIIEYIQNISNDSNNMLKISKIYNLNLNNPNNLLLAKYKQTGLFDYIINKYPNLQIEDVNQLIDNNISKSILDQINHIKVKNKIMKYFKSLR